MDKHIETAIPAIESAVSNFYKVENAYFFEMYNIDYKSGSIIEEEHLSEVEKKLTLLKGEISTFIQNMNSEIKSVDHIIGLESTDVGDFEDGLDSLIKISEKLREDFETYEKSKLMEAKGIQWVIDASVATVEGCMGVIDTMQGYVPETNAELEVPEYIKRASTFYDVYQYTDERYQDVLDNKADQTKLYYKYMESERLSQYFNNMLFATASMVLPFGNKIKGAKLALHEGVTIISFAYSADRTYKGYELMQQVEAMDADSEANGLFNLENSEYGEYVIALGETCNLYTAASASNMLEYKVFGKPVTISSNIATCGEEYISDKTNNLIYQITGEQNLITSVISGMVGNGFVNGVKLEIEDAGRLDIDPSVDYDVDIHNNSDIIEVHWNNAYITNVGNTNSKPSSKVLRDNLIASGKVPPNYKNAAHHIVAGSSPKAAEARAILQKYNIDINSAENGVFLPTQRGVSNASYHPSLHTNSYYEKVNSLLREAKSKEDVEDILRYIEQELEKGTF